MYMYICLFQHDMLRYNELATALQIIPAEARYAGGSDLELKVNPLVASGLLTAANPGIQEEKIFNMMMDWKVLFIIFC